MKLSGNLLHHRQIIRTVHYLYFMKKLLIFIIYLEITLIMELFFIVTNNLVI